MESRTPVVERDDRCHEVVVLPSIQRPLPHLRKVRLGGGLVQGVVSFKPGGLYDKRERSEGMVMRTFAQFEEET